MRKPDQQWSHVLAAATMLTVTAIVWNGVEGIGVAASHPGTKAC